jgi:predicted AAA+ superfamily ATPase
MISNPFRLDLPACRKLLGERLAEPAPARIQLLAGPRQVGKTTLMLELCRASGAGGLYVACDGPEMALTGAWEKLWSRAEELALAGGAAAVFLDELPQLSGWAARLKGEWDRLRRRRIPVHVVASGSSALHLGRGSKESLAGRFERIELAHWSARALAAEFHVSESEAVELIVRQGGFPGAMGFHSDPVRWSAYVREAIVEPAIGRDILALALVRKPALLRQVFSYCASAPAQIVSLQKLQGNLHDSGSITTVAAYLRLLEEAFLVLPLQKHSHRAARQRNAPPKLVTLSNASLAVADPRGIPDRDKEPARFGAWVENAVLAHAWNQGQQVEYWREEPYEVDGVLEGSWGKWVIEVKTGAFQSGDLRGLGEFKARFPEYRQLVLCEEAQIPVARRSGLDARNWRQFLLDGPG